MSATIWDSTLDDTFILPEDGFQDPGLWASSPLSDLEDRPDQEDQLPEDVVDAGQVLHQEFDDLPGGDANQVEDLVGQVNQPRRSRVYLHRG